MRLVFAGTSRFARVALEALTGAGHEICLVLTQPDRPAGRGHKPAQSEVKQIALRQGIEVFQPVSLRDEGAQARLLEQRAQAMVVAAYGLILPKVVLRLFPLGCVNIHASLLPRWRGAAPIQRAILAGDQKSGVCIMQMEEGLDTGPILLCQSLVIDAKETGGTLHDKLAALGSKLIVQALSNLEAGTAKAMPQSNDGVTYARKISKEEARIDWSQEARHIDAQIRAFDPVPVAFTNLAGEPIRIWRASVVSGGSEDAKPGHIVAASSSGIDVACGKGVLRILELQKAGGKRLQVPDFLRGQAVPAGSVLGN
ncbi:MAG: methionyl-tRNA formyltransferase [Betaproteobacteria bacterium]|nr:methionyl-tRNA formyltransferase [Betaproteobacteria bacterium]